jgi:hypothetical protein
MSLFQRTPREVFRVYGQEESLFSDCSDENQSDDRGDSPGREPLESNDRHRQYRLATELPRGGTLRAGLVGCVLLGVVSASVLAVVLIAPHLARPGGGVRLRSGVVETARPSLAEQTPKPTERVKPIERVRRRPIAARQRIQGRARRSHAQHSARRLEEPRHDTTLSPGAAQPSPWVPAEAHTPPVDTEFDFER